VSTASGVGTHFVQTKWNLKHLMHYSFEVRDECETITNIEITNFRINFPHAKPYGGMPVIK